MADKNDNNANTELQNGEKTISNVANFTNGQLSCLGQDLERIPESLIEGYCKVTLHLDLSFNRLHSLEGVDNFESLEELILDNNQLNDDIVIPPLKRLHTLTLNKNKICNLDKLLDCLYNNTPNIRYLSLLGNTACPNQLSSTDKDDDDYRRYRYYVIYRLPKLQFLDSSPVKKSEILEASRVGPYMKTVKVREDEIKSSVPDSSNSSDSFTPLPTTSREQHIGTFGKSRYIYYGRHSEGNRFIKNNDL